VKIREGACTGAREHAYQARLLFEQVASEAGTTTFWGLSLQALSRCAEEVSNQEEPAQADPKAPVSIVFAFSLELFPLPTA
jgi:hypothetical protein